MSSKNKTIVAVQWQLNEADYKSIGKFRDKLNYIMDEAAKERKSDLLVAFPEDIVTFGILTELMLAEISTSDLKMALEAYVKRNFLGLLGPKLKMGNWVPAIFLRCKNLMEEYFATFKQAAKDYNCLIVAGSGLIAEGRALYNESRGYDPGGIGVIQRKIHLIPLEDKEGLGLTPAPIDNIFCWGTNFGQIAITICFDGFQKAVIDKVAGADIIVQPSANPGPWTKEQQIDWLLGAHNMVQSAANVVINPMLTGSVLGLEFYGQSSILVRGANEGLGYLDTEPLPHFAKVAKSPLDEEILVLNL